MRIAITGDREWKDDRYPKIKRVLEILSVAQAQLGDSIHFILGDARGVDALALRACKELGLPYTKHDADWKRYGKAAGPIRNRAMLDDNPDQVWYFHDDLERSKGTKNCVEQAESRGILVVRAI